MLNELEKMTITQAELGGHNHRSKQFRGALPGAAATLFNTCMSSVNTVNLATVRRHAAEIQTEIPQIKEQLATQSASLQTIDKTLKGIVVIFNTHSVLLTQTVNSMKQLFTVFQNDFAQTQLVTALMTDTLLEVNSSIDSLAMGRIPPHLIPLSLVQTVLASAITTPADSLQIHLSYPLGSASPLCVDPKQREVGFAPELTHHRAKPNLPAQEHCQCQILKSNTHIKIRTPDVVNFNNSYTKLSLAPNPYMCTLTKDTHYLCPNKPFLGDNTFGICRLQISDTPCPAEAKPRTQIIETQAEIVGDRAR
ncbi:uncharacterized protein LOC143738977 [Siphateles boraxobius]|uniref:uncharacterized protein LOC143738977 n=1 Tax=Siphateles boraxobius TaxID=180520 RepID=UPI0040636684